MFDGDYIIDMCTRSYGRRKGQGLPLSLRPSWTHPSSLELDAALRNEVIVVEAVCRTSLNAHRSYFSELCLEGDGTAGEYHLVLGGGELRRPEDEKGLRALT